MTPEDILVRPFQPTDAAAVRRLFIDVNRSLAPPEMAAAFEDYIQRSLEEEMGRVADYYSDKGGGFWVAVSGDDLMGMFGLEPSEGGVELRRMYVHPNARRRGVARRMLMQAEAEARRIGAAQLDLSTSELQGAALSLYQNAGYTLVREEVAEAASNKTLGGGLRRFYFVKMLRAPPL